MITISVLGLWPGGQLHYGSDHMHQRPKDLLEQLGDFLRQKCETGVVLCQTVVVAEALNMGHGVPAAW
jgi:hypothetical protein